MGLSRTGPTPDVGGFVPLDTTLAVNNVIHIVVTAEDG